MRFDLLRQEIRELYSQSAINPSDLAGVLLSLLDEIERLTYEEPNHEQDKEDAELLLTQPSTPLWEARNERN